MILESFSFLFFFFSLFYKVEPVAYFFFYLHLAGWGVGIVWRHDVGVVILGCKNWFSSLAGKVRGSRLIQKMHQARVVLIRIRQQHVISDSGHVV